MARVHSLFAVVLASGLVTTGACKKDEKKADPSAKTTDKAKSDTTGKTAEQPALGGGGATDDLSLLPVDSEAVMGLNFAQLQASSLWKQFVQPQMMKGEFATKMAEFKTKCGFDPFAEIKSMSFGLKGFGGDKPDGVIVVRGPNKAQSLACFDKMKDEAAKSGDEITRDGDFVSMKFDKEPVALTFIDDTTAVAVVGPNATKDGVMKAAAGGSTLKTSPAFVEMYSKINTQASMWMLINGNAKVFEKTAGMGVKPKAVFGSLNVTDGLNIDFRMRVDSPDQATQMANAFKGQVAGFAQMADKLDITSDGPDVKLVVAMSQQKLENAIKNLGAMMGGAMMGGGAGAGAP